MTRGFMRGHGVVVCLAACALMVACSSGAHRARESDSAAAVAMKKLPRKSAAQRLVVAIYDVGSSLPELPPRGATQMFRTALVKSGQFRVVERARLNNSVMVEKQMNAAGQTTGSTAGKKLTGVEYIFDAEITEIASGTQGSTTGVQIAGLNLGGASGSDSIGLDVSIIDAGSGEVVDAVSVRRKLASSGVSISGVGALVSNAMAQRGKTASVYTPDVNHSSTRRDSLDAGLRECVDEAVRLLATRFEAARAQ